MAMDEWEFDEAVGWLFYYKDTPSSRLSSDITSAQIKALLEYTYDENLHKENGIDRTAVFRGVKHMYTRDKLLSKLVSGNPIFLKRKP